MNTEQMDPELKQILGMLNKHFKQAKDAMKMLTPANSLQTNSINFIDSVFGVIKTGVKSLVNYYESKGNQPDIASANLQNKFPEQENGIQEMSSMAVGSAMGGPSNKFKNQRQLVGEDKDLNENESIKKLRKVIRESIEECYKENKTFLNENIIKIIKENNEINSTGMNKLNEVFNEIRAIIENKYMLLTTSKEQRHSFALHLLKAVQDELNRLDMNSSAASAQQSFASEPWVQESNTTIKFNILKNGKTVNEAGVNPLAPKLPKELPPEDDDDAFKQKFSIQGLNETGRNEALETYKNIFPKIEESFNNLSDKEDREIFKQYLIENLEALFEKLEGQIGEDESEYDDFDLDHSAPDDSLSPENDSQFAPEQANPNSEFIPPEFRQNKNNG